VSPIRTPPAPATRSPSSSCGAADLRRS
jgi:hypothetical protein